jgi:hypothetical protein
MLPSPRTTLSERPSSRSSLPAPDVFLPTVSLAHTHTLACAGFHPGAFRSHYVPYFYGPSHKLSSCTACSGATLAHDSLTVVSPIDALARLATIEKSIVCTIKIAPLAPSPFRERTGPSLTRRLETSRRQKRNC